MSSRSQKRRNPDDFSDDDEEKTQVRSLTPGEKRRKIEDESEEKGEKKEVFPKKNEDKKAGNIKKVAYLTRDDMVEVLESETEDDEHNGVEHVRYSFSVPKGTKKVIIYFE